MRSIELSGRNPAGSLRDQERGGPSGWRASGNRSQDAAAPAHRIFSADASGHAMRTMTEIISTVAKKDRSHDGAFSLWADQHGDLVRRTVDGLADAARRAYQADPQGARHDE